MKLMMIRILSVSVVFRLLAPMGVLAEHPGSEPKPPVAPSELAVPAEEPLMATWKSETVCVYEKGEWTLQIEYLRKGTRSEGQDGKLLKAGKSVDGTTVGGLLETTLGKLKYYGSERKSAWSLTGWNFSDRRLVKRSTAVIALPSTNAVPAKIAEPCCCEDGTKP